MHYVLEIEENMFSILYDHSIHHDKYRVHGYDKNRESEIFSDRVFPLGILPTCHLVITLLLLLQLTRNCNFEIIDFKIRRIMHYVDIFYTIDIRYLLTYDLRLIIINHHHCQEISRIFVNVEKICSHLATARMYGPPPRISTRRS